jgi:hypothetical protein
MKPNLLEVHTVGLPEDQLSAPPAYADAVNLLPAIDADDTTMYTKAI